MENNNLIAGVDEAGRGPLAGPVFAAAVILDQAITIPDLTDSKKLSAKKREAIATVIKEQALAFAIGIADVAEIDEINILQASLLAMQRAIAQLTLPPQQVLVDGNQCPKVACAVKAIVNGDLLVPAISAASILAKVARDAEMVRLDALYPGYGLATHKGYGTKMHLAALDELGVSVIHRRSFKPVRDRCYAE